MITRNNWYSCLNIHFSLLFIAKLSHNSLSIRSIYYLTLGSIKIRQLTNNLKN